MQSVYAARLDVNHPKRVLSVSSQKLPICVHKFINKHLKCIKRLTTNRKHTFNHIVTVASGHGSWRLGLLPLGVVAWGLKMEISESNDTTHVHNGSSGLAIFIPENKGQDFIVYQSLSSDECNSQLCTREKIQTYLTDSSELHNRDNISSVKSAPI
jgi:hypothetical protein